MVKQDVYFVVLKVRGEHIDKYKVKGYSCINNDACNKEISMTSYISNQVKSYINSYKGKRVNKYIAYFQNYTNTYDTIDNLKLKYDSSLIDDRIVSLAIATRPDCITEDICKLLHSYTDKYYVYVELGLQTSNDETASLINRGYTKDVFTNAVKLLNKYNIDVVAHIMVGLPNENMLDIKNIVDLLNNHNLQGIKIHSTYVVKNTKLEELYNNNKYVPITLNFYLDCLEYIITHINDKVIIHRITGDAPRDILVAPLWNSNKKLVLNGLFKRLNDKDFYQGMFYNN